MRLLLSNFDKNVKYLFIDIQIMLFKMSSESLNDVSVSNTGKVSKVFNIAQTFLNGNEYCILFVR